MSDGFGMGKTAFVFAVIFGCFAILYPRIFHPMLKSALGIYNKPPPRTQESGPPHPDNVPPKRKESDPYKETIERTVQSLKAGPHPGMRTETVKRGDGVAKSGMAMSVLPIYTVGLVVFLVYTLTKVLFKKPAADEITREQLKNIRYSSNEKKFTFGDDFEGDDNLQDFLRKKEQNLPKPETRKITEYELCQLQRRLEETENAMEKIVAQMSSVSEKLATTMLPPTRETNNTYPYKECKTKRNDIQEDEEEVLTVEIEELSEDKVEEQTEINSDLKHSETFDKCPKNCETLGILKNELIDDTDSHDSEQELFDTSDSIFENSTENYNEDVNNDDKIESQVRKRVSRDNH